MNICNITLKTTPNNVEELEASDIIMLHLDTGVFIDDIPLYPIWTINRDLESVKQDIEKRIQKNIKDQPDKKYE